ncbi:hypothetical protein MBLNU230_g1506t1 [Neophaeotheca triangularis]
MSPYEKEKELDLEAQTGPGFSEDHDKHDSDSDDNDEEVGHKCKPTLHDHKGSLGDKMRAKEKQKENNREIDRKNIKKFYKKQKKQAKKHSKSWKKHKRTELEVFQRLAGIRFLGFGGVPLPDPKKPASNVWDDIFRPSKASEQRFHNRGLYDRAHSLDVRNRVMHSLTRYISAGLYVVQIIIAATLTAISSRAGQNPGSITALSGVNTVLAGVLAWLTGQGWPVRFRRGRDQYRGVVKAIEAAERTFAVIDFCEWEEGKRPDPVAEFRRLQKMFDEAFDDQVANYPQAQNDASAGKMKDKQEGLQAKVEKNKKEKQQETNALKEIQAKLDEVRSKALPRIVVGGGDAAAPAAAGGDSKPAEPTAGDQAVDGGNGGGDAEAPAANVGNSKVPE